MRSNLGLWDEEHKKFKQRVVYGDALTMLVASAFLSDVKDIEDWGCGGGGFRDFCVGQKYTGLDGSTNPFVDKIIDVCDYRSRVEGILMRHVIEHNENWRAALENAVASFTKKFCLILFTPFAEETKEIARGSLSGIDVPDISFKREDIESRFRGLDYKLIAGIGTRTQYGVEHIYLVWRGQQEPPQ